MVLLLPHRSIIDKDGSTESGGKDTPVEFGGEENPQILPRSESVTQVWKPFKTTSVSKADVNNFKGEDQAPASEEEINIVPLSLTQDLQGMKETENNPQQTDRIRYMSFSPNGKLLVTSRFVLLKLCV
jgi:hypothetical protein